MTAVVVDQSPFPIFQATTAPKLDGSVYTAPQTSKAQWSAQSIQSSNSMLMFSSSSSNSSPEIEADAEMEVGNSPISLDFSKESHRLQSFSTVGQWPSWAGLQPQQLAPEGFYYTGVRDEVRCFSCEVLLRLWRSDDDVRERHKKASPSCGFLISRDLDRRPNRSWQVPIPESNAGMEHEVNRLATFSHGWPSSCPIKPGELAKSGFFYSGVSDSVICFSCGVSLREWERGDTADGEHQRVNPLCLFLNGKVSTNVPLNPQSEQQGIVPSRHLVNEDARRQTFTNWPHASPVSPRDLAEAGFYYSGIRDAVKCFSCSVTIEEWVPGDIPIEEHIKHSPRCSFAKTLVERKLQQQSSSSRPQETMNYEQRLASFSQWPHDSPVSASDLAEAGFYSTGKGDRVTCFSCGGILKNWQKGDSAWGEHTKYFPSCQHVQQHVPMAVIPQDEPWSELLESPTEQQQEKQGDDFIQQAVQVGFSEELATRVKARHQTIDSFERFIEMLFTEQEMTTTAAHSSHSLEASPQAYKAAVAPPPTQNMPNETEETQESRLCKICMDNEATILFLPCAHILCCQECADSVNTCPICRKTIQSRIRSFFA